MGVPTLSALGIALTCNHFGKRPQAGLGRGLKEGAGELQQTRRETKASSGANSLAVGWLPRLEGPAQAGLPWEESGGACSLCLGPAGGRPAAGAVCGARSTGSGRLEGYEQGGKRTEIAEHKTTWACISFATPPLAQVVS